MARPANPNQRLVKQLPRPLAQLYKRAFTAPSPFYQHQAALYFWEAATELLGIACLDEHVRQGGELQLVAQSLGERLKPTVGNWRGWVRRALPALTATAGDHFDRLKEGFQAADERELARATDLFRELPVAPDGCDDFSLNALFDRLVEYRNKDIGHGAIGQQKEPDSHYEHMAQRLREGLEEAFLRLAPLAGRQLLHVLNVRKGRSGEFQVDYKFLRGDDDLPVRSIVLPKDLPTEMIPLSEHLYFAPDGTDDPLSENLTHWRIVTPWAICRKDDVYLFGGAYGSRKSRLRIRYLCYSAGVDCEESYLRDEGDVWPPPFFNLFFADGGDSPDEPVSEELPPPKPGSSRSDPIVKPTGQATIPARIGEYEIRSILGKGAMGRVYRAWQRALDREVALKVLSTPDEEGDLARFEREVQALARVDHPAVVKVHHSGEDHGRFYFTMDLIEGTDLAGVYKSLTGKPAENLSGDDWVEAISTACKNSRSDETWRSGRPPDDRDRPGSAGSEPPPSSGDGAIPSGVLRRSDHIGQAVELIRQVAEGVHALHQRSVIHRDIKPGNIRVSPDGRRAVLVDLGLVKLADEPGAGASTGGLTTNFVGTPRYSSPQQVAQAKSVDHRTDIYSLGATLWELLSLKPMFGDTANKLTAELITRITAHEPQRPRRHNPRVPTDLEAVVLKCLEKDPDERYQTALELAADLARWQRGEPVVARLRSPLYRVGKFVQRNWLAVGTTVIALYALLLTAAVLFVWDARQRAEGDRRRAEVERSRAVASAAEAQKQEQSAVSERTRAESAEKEALRLTTAMISRDGLDVAEKNDLVAALPYFAHALEMARKHGEDTMPHRMRLISTLGQLPQLQQLLVLKGDVRQAEFAEGGQVVATLHSDEINVWNAQTGEKIAFVSFPDFGHIAISPDGRQLAAVGLVHQLFYWNLPNEAGAATVELPLGSPRVQHEGEITWLGFSPDGKWLASTGADKFAWLFSTTNDGESPAKLVGHTDTINHAAFSPDSRWLATCSDDKSVRIWNVETRQPRMWDKAAADAGEKMDRLEHQSAVGFASFSADGKQLLTVDGLEAPAPRNPSLPPPPPLAGESSERGWMVEWDWEQAILTERLTPPFSMRYAVYLSEDQSCVAVAKDGQWLYSKLDSTSSGKSSYDAPFPPVCFPDGQGFALVENNTVTLQILGESRDGPVLPHFSSLRQVAFSTDGALFWTLCEDGTLRTWRFEFPVATIINPVNREVLYGEQLSRDGRLALVSAKIPAQVGEEKQGLLLVDTQTGEARSQVWPSDADQVAYAAAPGFIRDPLSPSGRFVVNQLGKLWDSQTNLTHPLASLPRGEEFFEPVHFFFDDDEKLLIAVGSRGNARYELPTGNYFRTESGVFSFPAMRRLVESIQQDRSVFGYPVVLVRFSSGRRSGWWVVAGQRLEVWQASGQQAAWVQSLADFALAAQISPDEKYLVVATNDQVVQLFELATGKQLANLKQGQRTHLLRFSPDSRTLLVVDEDGNSHVITVPDGRMLTIGLRSGESFLSDTAFLNSTRIVMLLGDGASLDWDLALLENPDRDLIRLADALSLARVGSEGVPERIPVSEWVDLGRALPQLAPQNHGQQQTIRSAQDLRD